MSFLKDFRHCFDNKGKEAADIKDDDLRAFLKDVPAERVRVIKRRDWFQKCPDCKSRMFRIQEYIVKKKHCGCESRREYNLHFYCDCCRSKFSMRVD